MTTEEVLKYRPTLTAEQAAELAEAVNRYAPAGGNEAICPKCQGDGFVSVGEGLFVCPVCHGERFVTVTPAPRPRLTEAQERARGQLAQRLADGENVPASLFW